MSFHPRWPAFAAAQPGSVFGAFSPQGRQLQGAPPRYSFLVYFLKQRICPAVVAIDIFPWLVAGSAKPALSALVGFLLGTSLVSSISGVRGSSVQAVHVIFSKHSTSWRLWFCLGSWGTTNPGSSKALMLRSLCPERGLIARKTLITASLYCYIVSLPRYWWAGASNLSTINLSLCSPAGIWGMITALALVREPAWPRHPPANCLALPCLNCSPLASGPVSSNKGSEEGWGNWST